VLFAALPLFHANAMMVTPLAPLLRGQHVVWAGPFGYRDRPLFGVFWKIVERYRIAAMSAVPTVYATLSQVPVDADITSLRLPIVDVAPLPAAVRDAFAQHTGRSLVEGYGLTEATCASTRNFPGTSRPGSVGHRLPYQRVKAVRVDENTGVRTDLPPAGEVPVGYVTIAPGPPVTPDDLTAWAAARVPERAAAPKLVTILDSLPLTAVGKPFKPELRRHAVEHAITERLARIGVDGVHAELADGLVTVVVPAPTTRTPSPSLQPWTSTPSPGGSNDHHGRNITTRMTS